MSKHQAVCRATFLGLLVSEVFMSIQVKASPYLFDFEEVSTGSRTSLVMTRAGFDVTLSRTSGLDFSIYNTSGSPWTGWGSRSLGTFVYSSQNDGLLFDFSAPAQMVSIETADYFADYDVVSITAYAGNNGSGTILDSMTLDWGTQGPPAFATLQASSPSILSVIARGGSASFPSSMYWDNLKVDHVPGPLPVFGAAMAFGCSRNLRRRIQSCRQG